MFQYHKVGVKLSDSQLNQLMAGVKNQTEVTLIISMKILNGNNYLMNYY